MTVEHGCAWFRFAPNVDTHRSLQRRSDRLPHACLCPRTDRQGHRPLVGRIMRNHALRTPTATYRHDPIHPISPLHFLGAPAWLRSWSHGFSDGPCGVCSL
jgi:hypothetical protein